MRYWAQCLSVLPFNYLICGCKIVKQTVISNITIILIACFFSAALSAQDRFLDPEFGTQGIASVAVPSPGFTRSAKLLAGGKVLLVGTCAGNTAGTSNARTCLVRLRDNGQADSSFANAGLAWPIDDDLSDFAFQAHEYSDGSVLVSGSRQVHPNGHAAVLYRFLPDGSRDTSFGVGGRLTNPYNTNFKLETYSLAVDAQGRIYMAGLNTQLPSLNNEAAVIRLLPNGVADLGWGDLGVARRDFSPTQGDSFGGKITPLANGQVLVSGAVSASATAPGRLIFARYNSNGALDTTFASAGIFEIDLTNGGVGSAGSQFLDDYLIDQQGRVWLFGTVSIGGNAFEGFIIRLQANGGLDAGFGSNGQRRYRLGSLSTRIRRALSINGQIYIAGNYLDDPAMDPLLPNAVVIKLQDNGDLDASFGENSRINLLNRDQGLVQLFERQSSTGRLVLAFTRQRQSATVDAFSAARINTFELAPAALVAVPGLTPVGLLCFCLLIVLTLRFVLPQRRLAA
jgi:uncharacterized delta-60 repeat protein